MLLLSGVIHKVHHAQGVGCTDKRYGALHGGSGGSWRLLRSLSKTVFARVAVDIILISFIGIVNSNGKDCGLCYETGKYVVACKKSSNQHVEEQANADQSLTV